MNNIANLLFPNETSIEELLKKYPPRNLKESEKVLRIAPSPTGYLHLGTFFSAFCQYIETRKTGGVFYIRLEDTDQKREVEGAGDAIVEMLNFYGVYADEGYNGDSVQETGNYGPYVQSKRKHIYNAFAKRLIELGRAFPCFCEKTESKDEVLQNRERALAQSGEICEKDCCRDLTYQQIEQNIKQGKKFAIRLKSNGDGSKVFKFNDFFKGEREIRENAKDIVLLKSDGLPTYALAHLADDTLMHTTMIVRGEEWFASLSAHIELFLACGLKPKKYGHTPLICVNDEQTGNKRKLSKRKDIEADVRYFANAGYPKQAIWEYIITLANSNFEDWRKQNAKENIDKFNFKLNKLGSNNPMFNFDKLNDISKNVISRLSAEEVYEQVLMWAKQNNLQFCKYLNENKEHSIAVFGIDRTPEKARKDIVKWGDVPKLFDYMFFEINEYEDKIDKNAINMYLNSNLLNFDSLDNQTWFAGIKKLVGECADKSEITSFVTNLRLAITGRKNSPDLFSICKILGKERVINRLQKVL